MKKIKIGVFIFFCIVLQANVFASSLERTLDDALSTIAGIVADDIAKAGKVVVAVGDFGDGLNAEPGTAGALGRYLGLALPSELQNAARGRFKIVDRSSIALLLKEQEFQFTGMVAEDSRKSFGSILACDVLVLGTIERLGDSALLIQVKAVKVETGEIVSSYSKRISLVAEVSALAGLSLAPDKSLVSRLGVTQASEPYSIRVVVNNQPKSYIKKEKNDWILAKPGEVYELEISNNTDRRAGVALLIDGINTAYMNRETPSKAVKWIIPAHCTVRIKGWQTSNTIAKQFEFSSLSESLAASFGRTSEIGIISASFYPEELNAKDAGSQQAGTKAGAAFGSKVETVSVSLEGFPAQVSVIRYDYVAGLKARGIQIP